MNRRAIGYFMPILTVTVIILLSMGLLTLVTQSYDEAAADGARVSPDIGAKQEATLRAFERGLLLETYARHAAALAVRGAERDTVRDQSIAIEEFALARFRAYMRAHPTLGIHVSFTAERLQNGTIRFRSETPISIPIETEEDVEAGTLPRSGGETGFLTTWPSDDRVVTSLFGKRTNSGGTPNHAGMDIRGAQGQELYAVGPGMVRHTAGKEWLALELDNGWTCEYYHITPAPGVVDRRIAEGQVIAHVGAHAAPHLDLRCYHRAQPLGKAQAQATLDHPAAVGTHTGGPREMPSDTTYAVFRQEEHAYIDPYCLFSPEIRSTLEVSDTLTGLRYRDGASTEEKLMQTCRAYTEKGLLQETQPFTAEALDTGDATLTRTITNLNEQTHDGKTLMQIVQEEAEAAGVDPQAVIAMIAAESGGAIGATSQTGVRGLMQVTCPTAKAVGVIADDGDCDALYDPRISIRAGTIYLRDRLARFEGYTHQVAFAAAEYNGGDIIKPLTGGNRGAVYEDTIVRADSTYLAANGYSSWSEERRMQKAEEIANHGRKVARYYQLSGGTVAPASFSRTSIGTYRLAISALADPDEALLADYQRLRESLEQSRSAEEAAAALSRHAHLGVTECTEYLPRLQQEVALCAAALEGACSCVVSLPEQGVSLRIDSEGAREAGDRDPVPLGWIPERYDEGEAQVLFSGSPVLDWQSILPDRLGLEGPNVELVGRWFWVTEHAVTPQTYALNVSANPQAPVCSTPSPRRYCVGEESFWVQHAFPLPQARLGDDVGNPSDEPPA